MNDRRPHPAAPIPSLIALGLALAAAIAPPESAAQSPGPPANTPDVARIVLWPEGNPDGWTAEGDESWEGRDDGIARLKNVGTPALEHFAPKDPNKATGAALIVVPGGGYNILAIDHEGWMVGDFMAERGVHVFVLRYRLPRPGKDDVRHLPALQDAQRAVSLLRSRAGELGIDPTKIGVMGFSAGGHLAALASTRFGQRAYQPADKADEASCRPDFAALIYPAYLVEKDSEEGTLSPDLVLSDDIPPTFFVHAEDDPVTVQSSLYYYLALQKLGVPAQMHLFAEGGHGYGMSKAKNLPIGTWPERLADWIHWVTKPTGD